MLAQKLADNIAHSRSARSVVEPRPTADCSREPSRAAQSTVPSTSQRTKRKSCPFCAYLVTVLELRAAPMDPPGSPCAFVSDSSRTICERANISGRRIRGHSRRRFFSAPFRVQTSALGPRVIPEWAWLEGPPPRAHGHGQAALGELFELDQQVSFIIAVVNFLARASVWISMPRLSSRKRTRSCLEQKSSSTR